MLWCIAVQGEVSLLSNGTVAIRCSTYLLLDSLSVRLLNSSPLTSCVVLTDVSVCPCVVWKFSLDDGTVDMTDSFEPVT